MTINKSKKIALDITVLGDRQKTGIGVYVFNLIKEILELNKKDQFILFGISSFKNYFYLKNLSFKEYPNVKLKIFPLPLKLFRRTFLLWQKINWPNIEMLIGEVDVFHSFNYYLPPQNKGKIIATVFDMTTYLFPKFHLMKTIELEQIRIERIGDRADVIVTISENSKKDFLKIYPQKLVEVIYPSISISLIKENGQKLKQVLDKYGLEQGYILFVGTLEPRKNIKTLIKAYLKSNLKEKLVLVGNFGWQNSKILGEINKNEHRIITPGYVPDEDLSFFYKGAICLIYPSFYEGFGIPVLEALNLGIPVISSKTSSMPEVGGKAVLYINPEEINSITKALHRIKNKKLRTKLIKMGFKQAKKFSWDKAAKKSNKLYQKLTA